MPRSSSSRTGRGHKDKKSLGATPREKKIPPPCEALTHSFVPCKNRANTKASRKIPVCWAHRKQGETVTRCQAVLENNRKCLKKIPWSERRQVCTKHVDSSLPCFIIRLPIELRQQIFSYILNEYQKEYVPLYTYFSILHMAQVNRQIYQDACDLLHRKLVCNISLRNENISILKKHCLSVRPGSWQRFKQFHFQFYDEMQEATINNLTLIVALIRDTCMKLSVDPTYTIWWHSHYGLERAIDALPSYLDIFRQLRGVREARVEMSPNLTTALSVYGWNSLNPEAGMAIKSKWESYYKQWVKDLERGHSAERDDSWNHLF